MAQSSLQIRYQFQVDRLSRWSLTAFWVKESDFTYLEICIPQQKTRSQLQKFIHLGGYTTLFFKITTMWRDTFVPSLLPCHPCFGKLAGSGRIEVRIRRCNNRFVGVQTRSRKHRFQAQKGLKIAWGKVRAVRGILRDLDPVLLWETLSSCWK